MKAEKNLPERVKRFQETWITNPGGMLDFYELLRDVDVHAGLAVRQLYREEIASLRKLLKEAF